jgi:cytochrome c6
MIIQRFSVSLSCISAVCAMACVCCANADPEGKRAFEENCAVCHPEGGNIINPDKPLSKSSLAAGGITSKDEMVRFMRNPGPGMTRFDEQSLPDSEARAIAAYILKAFR